MATHPAGLLSILLAAAAATLGCAQCQQNVDATTAAAVDERLFARIGEILGDQTVANQTPEHGRQASRELDVAQTRRKASRRPTPAKSSIELAAAAESLEEAAPMRSAEPIETAPPPAAAPKAAPISNLAGDRRKAPEAPDATPKIEAKSCDDACCELGSDGTICQPCPVIGACGRCRACLAGLRCSKLFKRPEPGPPPVRYQPPMPPKFLPVPTQPVLSPARPEAPDAWRGDVEFGWRRQMTFPGRD